ncbi:MAG: DNA polymerase III subunit chi [Candidatus Auribacter fodinae]|jgi:DNA polymerase-3 subunit chi|uniref:DNA polymerase III subunit chi n=1 Tax=Candidatus Auribacter fodinae TaxID=2093366 RepID=A0A3A4RGF8_9BACT|nr:MAG: DNA polymerase III subunit chi [Candidatus Auribacter fodinae]
MTEPVHKRAWFYILHEPEKNNYICAITEHRYEQGNSVYIYAGTPEQAGILDDLLWTFKPSSFVPHEVFRPEKRVESPVVIGGMQRLARHYDYLIVASDYTERDMAFIERFPRIVDFAEKYDDNLVLASRKRYALLRNCGYEIDTIEKNLSENK